MNPFTREVMAGVTLFQIPSTGHSNSLTSSSMNAIIAKMEELDADGVRRAVFIGGQAAAGCTAA